MKHIYMAVILLVSFAGVAQNITIPNNNFRNRLLTGMCVDSDGDLVADTDLDFNNDGQIQLSEAQSITYLYLDGSNISSLQGIDNFTNLTILLFSNNQVTNVDLSALTNLEKLHCASNRLTSLNVSMLNNLIDINCGNNRFTFLDVSNLPNLKSFNCTNNIYLSAFFIKNNNTAADLETIAFHSCPSLTHICADTADFPVIQTHLATWASQINPNVLDSSCDIASPCGAGVICINDSKLKQKLISLGLDTNHDGKIQVAEVQNVTSLTIQTGTGTTDDITNLAGLEQFPNLQTLNCSNNNLPVLNFTAYPALKSLDVSNCKTTSLTVAGMSTLQVLKCSDNLLTTLNLNGLSALLTLNCNHNQLTTLNLMSLTAATTIDCGYNSLQQLDFSNLSTLKVIDFGNNLNLSTLYLNGLANLEYITCDYTKLPSLDLTPYVKLKWVKCGNNDMLQILDVSGLPQLATLYCNATSPAIVDVSASPLLSTLDFSYANIDYLNLRNNSGIFAQNLNFVFADVDYMCVDAFELSTYNGSNWFAQTQISTNCNFGNINNVISGNLYLNLTGNCNENGIPFNLGRISTNSNYFNTVFTNQQGHYELNTMNSSIIVTPVFINNYFTATPQTFSYNFPADGSNVTADFCIQPNGIHHDLEVNPYSVKRPRPGEETGIYITYKNNGNQIMSGTVSLSFNEDKLNYDEALPNNPLVTPGNLAWNFTNLMPFESRTIKIAFDVNAPTDIPAVNIDDQLNYTATITSNQAVADENLADNTINFKQTVVGSFDPNDKSVLEGSAITLTQAAGYLNYLIRFQNTGNAEALKVRIEDLIASNLDINTLQIINGSHPFQASINGRQLEVYFNNINLPPMSQDDAGSQGFIAFKIKPVAGFEVGSTFQNRASIFFDANFPIITNTTTTTIIVLSAPEIKGGPKLSIYPNPTSGLLNIEAGDNAQVTSVLIYNTLGQLVQSVVTVQESALYILDVNQLQSGNYLMVINSDKGQITRKFIKQ